MVTLGQYPACHAVQWLFEHIAQQRLPDVFWQAAEERCAKMQLPDVV